MKELAHRPLSIRVLRSVLFVLCLVTATHVIGRDFIPFPGAALCLAVILCACKEGMTGALAGAVPALLYLAWRHSIPGAPFQYEPQEGRLLLLWALCLPLSAALTGALSSRAFQSRTMERERQLAETREAETALHVKQLQSAQREIEDRERRYRFLADSMPQMVWTSRADGKSDYFNRRWLDFTGLSMEETMAGGWVNIMHPDDLQKCLEVWKSAVTSGTHYETEYRLRRAGEGDERWRWHLARAEPLRDGNGRIVQWVGTCTDIHDQRTARVALERRVRERTAELESANRNLSEQIAARRVTEQSINRILTYSRDIICTIDGNARIVQISKACETVLGYTPEELAGRFVGDIIHPEDHAAAAASASRIIEGRNHGEFLERWFKKDGSVIFMLWSARWSKEDQLMFCVGRDITQIRKAAEDLKGARLAAEEANRAKSEFLAVMSHEIRTPLNGVLGMTGLLLDTALTREQRGFAETIRQSGELLLTLINDILDFSKIEAGRLTFENLNFDLQEAVDGTLELLAGAAQAKGVELLSEVFPEVPVRLRGDEGRLRQVLTNLLNNAVKFTGPGGEVYLRVRRQETEAGGALLCFEVRDTGIGIREEARKRLFEPFSQADASTTRKYGGTGLGLAICKQIVELMGGRIGVESEPGKGSLFRFTARFDLQPEEAPAGAGDSADDSAAHAVEGLRVLAVDDNPASLGILKRRLESWRMRCVTVENGQKALARLKGAHEAGSPFDAVVLDMQMAETNGLDLARKIKSDPALAAVHILALSPVDAIPDAAALEEAGIADYLVKPPRPSRLFDSLSTLTAKHDEEPVAPRALPSVPAAKGGVSAAPEPRRRRRVLLAEDNPVNQKVALLQLGKLGYQADAVASGSEAVEALRNVPYDIILMDCQMPEMDGYEASRRLRAMEAGAADRAPAHIIALTANAMAGDREKCLAAGMNDYITKPVRLPELEAALAKLERA